MNFAAHIMNGGPATTTTFFNWNKTTTELLLSSNELRAFLCRLKISNRIYSYSNCESNNRPNTHKWSVCVCVCPLEWTWMLRRNCYLSCVMTSGNLPYFRENWKLAHMCRRRWCERILFRCRQPKICKKAFDTSFLFFHFLVFKWMKKSHSNVSRFATVSKLLNGYRASAENNSICKTWCASQFDGDRHSRSEWKKTERIPNGAVRDKCATEVQPSSVSRILMLHRDDHLCHRLCSSKHINFLFYFVPCLQSIR